MNVDVDREIKNELGEEVADVLVVLFAVAIKLGVDVEDELLKKVKVIDERTYKRQSK